MTSNPLNRRSDHAELQTIREFVPLVTGDFAKDFVIAANARLADRNPTMARTHHWFRGSGGEMQLGRKDRFDDKPASKTKRWSGPAMPSAAFRAIVNDRGRRLSGCLDCGEIISHGGGNFELAANGERFFSEARP